MKLIAALLLSLPLVAFATETNTKPVPPKAQKHASNNNTAAAVAATLAAAGLVAVVIYHNKEDKKETRVEVAPTPSGAALRVKLEF